MIQVISETTQKARKPHVCNYCRLPIEIGQEYIRQLNVIDESYTWKMHTHCNKIALKLIDFNDTDNGGAGCEDFYYAVNEKCIQITGKINGSLTISGAIEIVRKELGV